MTLSNERLLILKKIRLNHDLTFGRISDIALLTERGYLFTERGKWVLTEKGKETSKTENIKEKWKS